MHLNERLDEAKGASSSDQFALIYDMRHTESEMDVKRAAIRWYEQSLEALDLHTSETIDVPLHDLIHFGLIEEE